mmetsp:Transcript_30893/g.91803  ORF Transcript_30893/g.91803 Transcript_30893/m.91803 type:complete len:297 (+) Transcript_30893:109-999(+)
MGRYLRCSWADGGSGEGTLEGWSEGLPEAVTVQARAARGLRRRAGNSRPHAVLLALQGVQAPPRTAKLLPEVPGLLGGLPPRLLHLALQLPHPLLRPLSPLLRVPRPLEGLHGEGLRGHPRGAQGGRVRDLQEGQRAECVRDVHLRRELRLLALSPSRPTAASFACTPDRARPPRARPNCSQERWSPPRQTGGAPAGPAATTLHAGDAAPSQAPRRHAQSFPLCPSRSTWGPHQRSSCCPRCSRFATRGAGHRKCRRSREAPGGSRVSCPCRRHPVCRGSLGPCGRRAPRRPSPSA